MYIYKHFFFLSFFSILFFLLISGHVLQDLEEMQLLPPPSEKPLSCLTVNISLSALLIKLLSHWRVIN